MVRLLMPHSGACRGCQGGVTARVHPLPISGKGVGGSRSLSLLRQAQLASPAEPIQPEQSKSVSFGGNHMRKRLAAVGLSGDSWCERRRAQPPQLPPPQFPVQPPRPLRPRHRSPRRFPRRSRPDRCAAAAGSAAANSAARAAHAGRAAPNPPRRRPPHRPDRPRRPRCRSRSRSAPFSAADVTVKRALGGWQVWSGQKMVRDLGDNENNARDLARVLRDLRPNEWVTIGGPKPVVEYGLINGRPAATRRRARPEGRSERRQVQAGTVPAGFAGPAVTGAGANSCCRSTSAPPASSRSSGVWCVRDDDNAAVQLRRRQGGRRSGHRGRSGSTGSTASGSSATRSSR